MSETTSLYSDTVIVGGGGSPLRVVPARIDIAGSIIQNVSEIARTDIDESQVSDLGSLVVSPLVR